MGFVTNMLSAGITSRGCDARKNQLAHGQAAKNKHYSNAASVERAAQANSLIEGEKMMDIRDRQRRTVGAYRARAGGSGFTSEGTGSTTAQIVSDLYGEKISDMAYKSSTKSINAVNQAIGLRRQGDEYMANATEYLEVFNIHTGHGRDTSLHAQCVFRGLVIFVLVDDVLLHPF